MPPIINAQKLTKSYGAAPLFEQISFTVSAGDRIALIGPNGSGKSTLLKLLAGLEDTDEGEISTRKRAKIAIIYQDSQFPPAITIRQVIEDPLAGAAVPSSERAGRLSETLGKTGFSDFNREAATLSGGWRKRLAIAQALAAAPGVVLFDEPTNHLDLQSIQWLEEIIERAPFASVIVSHDRYFLENTANEVVELNRLYPDGLLRVRGNYSKFLIEKELFLESQAQRHASLENRVKSEIEWLRRGPKARTTKSKARIDKAHEMIGDLADVSSRSRINTAKIDFSATDRKTKRLLELNGVSYAFGDHKLFKGLDFAVTSKMRVGLVGANGSGKTTLLRLMQGEIAPTSGEIRRADALRIVYFEQNRVLDPEMTLKRALAPHGDSVIFQDRVVHVASWANRFLFSAEQLNQPVGRLSGGERARVLIAKLMLEPADLLLLDEPTNDLDIPTLEILEESLLEFHGAIVLVTHDRYLLDKVSSIVLGLDGEGGIGAFADYLQWEAWQAEASASNDRSAPFQVQVQAKANTARETGQQRKKLSYLEAREYTTLEDRVTEAEDRLHERRQQMEEPSIGTDAARLLQAQRELDEAQDVVDQLYARWAELETKMTCG
ncbi:MAG: ABC-F family ATP-binding cassette domain-containing protein [Acidobacteriaceae bacterium]